MDLAVSLLILFAAVLVGWGLVSAGQYFFAGFAVGLLVISAINFAINRRAGGGDVRTRGLHILDYIKIAGKPIAQVGDIGVSPDGRKYRVIQITETNDAGWMMVCQYEEFH